jgi:hypothetical protein
MHAMDDLQQMERAAFKRFYDDGLLDIFMGVMIGTLPLVALLTDMADGSAGRLAVYLGVYGVMVGVFVLARRKITTPRLGTFRPGPERRRKVRSARIVLGLSVVLGLALMLLFATGAAGSSLATWVPLMFLLNATVVFGVAAHFLDVPRFWAYGPAFGLPIVIDAALDGAWDVSLPAWVVFGVPGLAVTLVGVIILVRFVRRYPIPAHGRANDDLA